MKFGPTLTTIYDKAKTQVENGIAYFNQNSLLTKLGITIICITLADFAIRALMSLAQPFLYTSAYVLAGYALYRGVCFINTSLENRHAITNDISHRLNDAYASGTNLVQNTYHNAYDFGANSLNSGRQYLGGLYTQFTASVRQEERNSSAPAARTSHRNTHH